ncbi:DoxX family protein [Micromonospora sp. CPCC 206061]|uniref:DoxX family protein n=1 Tax=Micromonospora sp. CPCC 206061 TaxID=3122410 RepID=UPI002FF35412
MNTLLATVLIGLFGVLGTAKLAAIPAMRSAARHLGFSVGQYRMIGALELAGVAGLALGFTVTPIGVAAATGLTLLMLGAAAAHLRNRDPLPRVLLPLLVAATTATYLLTLP